MQCDAWDGSSRLQFVPVTVNSVVPFFLASGALSIGVARSQRFFFTPTPSQPYKYLHVFS